jgi:hypothetical protein
VIFHAFEKADRSILAQTLCDRQNGIGADGLIVLIPHPEYDFEWEFYNADGSTASKKSAKRLSRTSKRSILYREGKNIEIHFHKRERENLNLTISLSLLQNQLAILPDYIIWRLPCVLYLSFHYF